MKSLNAIVAVSLLCTNVIFCQSKSQNPTKEETQQWINQKISQYAFEDSGTKHKYSISFSEDFMVVDHTTYTFSTLGNVELHAIKKIPIKLIQSFYFTDKSATYWLTINMKNNENAISVAYDDLPIKYYSSTQFILSKSLDSENLKERMLKACNYLLELYTGVSTKEPF